MSDDKSLCLGSFSVFKNSLNRLHCSTPFTTFNNEDVSGYILSEMHRDLEQAKLYDLLLRNKSKHHLLNLSPDRASKISSDLSESEGFNSFTSKSYNGDESDLDDSLSVNSSKSDSVYFSALSNQSDGDSHNNLENEDCENNFRDYPAISTIIYGFSSDTPLHYSLLGFNDYGSSGMTSFQMINFTKKRKFYTLSKISAILPEPRKGNELTILCMQCSLCSKFYRLQSSAIQEPFVYCCPRENCGTTLSNPVFNIKLILEMGSETKEVLLVDEYAVLFFGIHPTRYLTDSKLRHKGFSALQYLLAEDKEHWFCVKKNFENNEYNIIETSLLYLNEDQLSEEYYHSKLFKYKL